MEGSTKDGAEGAARRQETLPPQGVDEACMEALRCATETI